MGISNQNHEKFSPKYFKISHEIEGILMILKSFFFSFWYFPVFCYLASYGFRYCTLTCYFFFPWEIKASLQSFRVFFNSDQILKSHHASALLIAHSPPPYNHEESYNLPTPCFLLAISSGSRFFCSGCFFFFFFLKTNSNLFCIR